MYSCMSGRARAGLSSMVTSSSSGAVASAAMDSFRRSKPSLRSSPVYCVARTMGVVGSGGAGASNNASRPANLRSSACECVCRPPILTLQTR